MSAAGNNVISFPIQTLHRTDVPVPPPARETPHLRVLSGGVDDEKAFARAYHAAVIAKAERDLIEARWLAEHMLSPLGHYSPLWEQREPAFEAMQQAIINLALTPARDKQQLRLKKSAIGNVWLKAEGKFYDQLRERIALDEVHVAGTAQRARY